MYILATCMSCIYGVALFLQSIATPSQIEITVLTGRSGQSVRDTLVRSSDRLNLEHLRKITVVCVSDPDRIARQNTPLVSGCDDVEGPQEAEQHVGLSQMTCSQAELGIYTVNVIRKYIHCT